MASMTTRTARSSIIAVAQMCSTIDKKVNLSVVISLVQEAKTKDAVLVCFPEACDFMGRPGRNDSLLQSEFLNGPTMAEYQKIAKEEAIYISFGFHEKLANESKRIANTHCLVDSTGNLVECYRKIHLFDVDYDGGYKESDTTVCGEAVKLVETPIAGNIGLTTCYDVRFPELYTRLVEKEADLILVPSAFMPTTGKAHWEVLLRARAIETQCYVVASAQCGDHNVASSSDRVRSSYGHSLAISPFGEVLLDLGVEHPKVDVFVMDFDYIESVRNKMPVRMHRKMANY